MTINYSVSSKKRRWPVILVTFMALVLIIAVGTVVAIRRIYNQNLEPASLSQKSITVTIPLGSSANEIASILAERGIIKSTWAFDWYVRSHEYRDKLQAGTYALRPSQSVEEIINQLTQGKVKTDLLTIVPGQRLDQVRQVFINAGFSEADVVKALDPALYINHPALTDKPTSANLEGYLYPESFQKTADTKPEALVGKYLDEMQKRLTPELRAKIAAQGLSVYQGIILASIIEQEVSKSDDKAQVAQVFLKRLRIDMLLQSDPTAIYGAVLANQPPSLRFESAYNTFTHKGLPPSPISNVSESSLLAVGNPAGTDWLFFVAGDDGVTYFSKTVTEHEALTAQHCKKLCNL